MILIDENQLFSDSIRNEHIHEANTALAINFSCQNYEKKISLVVKTKSNSMDNALRPIIDQLMRELKEKPNRYQLAVGAVIGFVGALLTLRLVKTLALVLGVIVLGLAFLTKFSIEIYTERSWEFSFTMLRPFILENTVFATGAVGGYLIGVATFG